MRFFIFLIFVGFSQSFLTGQMIRNGETFYGNEWMEKGKTYFKFSISEDGIYKISALDALASGITMKTLKGSQLFVINMGEQIPIYVSSSEFLTDEAYILFYAEKNKGKLDAHLYNDPEKQQLNIDYSLHSDVNAYYLGWNENVDNSRIEEKLNEFDPNNLPSKERFYQHVDKKIFNDFHFKPTHNGRDFIRYSSYDTGEGYGSFVRKETSVAFALDHIYLQGSRPKVKARFTGNASNHFIETKINDLILNQYFRNGYGINEFEVEFNSSHLSEDLVVDVIGNKGRSDKHSIASVSISYPRGFNFRGASTFDFQMSKSFIPRYLEIENFNTNGNGPLLFDISNHEVYKPFIESGIVKVVIPASVNDRKLLLINSSEKIQNITDFTPLESLIDISTIGNFLVISNSDLYHDAQGNNWVEAYADYRKSVQGGMYDVSVVDIKDLYEEYGYGINGHSITVKNFISHVLSTGNQLESVFIIGKGLEYPLVRKKESLKDQVKCFVPTFGSPGGDNLFAAEGGNFIPKVPIGRLASQNAIEVKNYLEKVKAYENPIDYADDESVLWRKKILHLSGGSADIQELLYGYLSDMEGVIRANEFGGEVFTFRKKTADLLQSSQTDEIIQKIDQGVSLITFFGHAAVGTFDFSLEDPSRYQNEGKTPIILSLGCHSGNIHSEGIGLSEDFVLEEKKGAIAFIASSGTAYINPQFHSGMNFYENVGDGSEDKSIGNILIRSLEKIGESQLVEDVTLVEQLTLHGDPLLKVYMSEGPDYISEYESFNIVITKYI